MGGRKSAMNFRSSKRIGRYMSTHVTLVLSLRAALMYAILKSGRKRGEITMHVIKCFGIVLLCAAATSAHGEERKTDFTIKGGCTVRAQAYTDKAYHPKESSRFTLEIVRTQKDSYNWDFTLDENPNYHYTNLHGGISPVPYGSKKQATVHAVLHQYDIYEERVMFKNLDLGPLSSGIFGSTSSGTKQKFDITPRYLALKEPVTATTPSGISITLPAQGAETLEKVFLNFNGNPNALFIRIETSPNQREVLLPESPLYKKHKKPVHIKLECPQPNSMVWYMADNTFKTIAVGLPNLKTVTHLDTLTLIIRQRVDLQSIPVAIKVPISRSPGE